MKFVSLDVETANADMSSICQIGMARFENGKVVDKWVSLIDPEDFFDDFNVDIHGISERAVRGAPKLPAVVSTLKEWLTDDIVTCHTHFDRVSMQQACSKYGISLPEIHWLDTARVARRTWEECADYGYGLADVCDRIGYSFKHHDALEDAIASGMILLAAAEKTGLLPEQWLKRINQPIDPSRSVIVREGVPEGEYFGQTVVFTGELEIPRVEAADLAASVGFNVGKGVTKKTNILVVGDQDIRKLAKGASKSAKYLKAETLIKKGSDLRIIQSTDFKYMVKNALYYQRARVEGE